MDASAMFLDCPAYMNKTGSVRCGLPAEVECRYLMRSTDGPLESVRIRCPRGHWFNGPVESLTLEERPDASAEREAIAQLKGAVVRRPAPRGPDRSEAAPVRRVDRTVDRDDR